MVARYNRLCNIARNLFFTLANTIYQCIFVSDLVHIIILLYHFKHQRASQTILGHYCTVDKVNKKVAHVNYYMLGHNLVQIYINIMSVSS
jgi:hypothetical protein